MQQSRSRGTGRTAALALTFVSGLFACLALFTAPGVVPSADGTYTESFLNNGVMQWTPLLIPLSALAGWGAGRTATWGVLGILVTQGLTAYVYMQRDQGGMGSLENFAYLYAGALAFLCLLAVLVGAWIRRVFRSRREG